MTIKKKSLWQEGKISETGYYWTRTWRFESFGYDIRFLREDYDPKLEWNGPLQNPDTSIEVVHYWCYNIKDDFGSDGKGWYFWDETGAYHYGPYETQESAQQKLDQYTKWLSGEANE